MEGMSAGDRAHRNVPAKKTAGKAFVSLGVKSSLDKDLRKSKATLKKFAKASAKLMAGAAAASFGVATAALVKLTNEAKEIRKLSGEIGVTTQEFQKLSYVSRQVGLDMDDMVGAIEEFRIRTAEAAQDGTGPLADMFKKLGLDAKEFVNMPITDAIGKVSDELNKLDATSKQFAADEIFGGDGRRLMNVFKLGAEGISEMSREAERMGLVLSKDAMAGLENISHAFLEMEMTFDSIAGNMANAWASELEYMLAFARLISEDIGTVFESASGAIISSLAKSMKWWFEQEGFTNEADFLNNLIEDNNAMQREKGERMADLIEQQRRRREDRENKNNGGKGGKKPFEDAGATLPGMLESYKMNEINAFSEMVGGFKPREALAASLSTSNSAVGGFVGGRGVGQETRWEVKINEDQLQEARRTNEILEEMKRMATLNGGGGTPWTGGI